MKTKKLLLLSLSILILTACIAEEVPASTSTLDAAVLSLTAISRATADDMQTQSAVPTHTLPPVFTQTAIPTLDRTRPPVQTPTAETPCNMAAAGQPFDVTIPDGTVIKAGEPYSKTWRLENTGRCKWTRQYQVTFFSGNSMGAIHNQFLAAEVQPGEVIDVTIDMVAPSSQGIYQGNWMLLDPQGELFGIGPNGDAPFWVQIEVIPSLTETPQPQVTATMTVTPMVYKEGEIVLINLDQVDLDTGVLNPENAAQVDFVYQTDGENGFAFSTMNSMVWAVMGESEPLFQNCLLAELTGEPLNFNVAPLGTYLCYKTSEGLPGRLLFEGYENEQLSIRFLTWSASEE